MRVKSLSAALATIIIAGLLAVAAAAPAGALLVSGTFTAVQCTTNPNLGTQAQDIPYGVDAPTTVNAGSEFTVTFPGGAAALPAKVLGFVPVASYSNLSTSYQVQGGTFDQPTYAESGPTLIDGVSTPSAHAFPAPDTLSMSTVGPIAPGTLTTPDRTVSVIAGAAGTTINIIEKTLTSTVALGTPPSTSNVTATCPVPSTILIPISVVNGGPTMVVDAGASGTG